jgi:poly(3-hydroxybutyrate) depolymerase
MHLQAACQSMCLARKLHARLRRRSFEDSMLADGHLLYHAYQAQADLLWPLRFITDAALPVLNEARDGPAERPGMRKLLAALEVFALARLTHRRPRFDIAAVTVDGREAGVSEEVAQREPFGTLLHFGKDRAPAQPRVLLVAPMSGHFATLLRDTARTMLADHDVSITDWHNARDVRLSDGRFGLDEYIDYLMRFLRTIGPGAHVVAICQPCVAALAATALLAEDGDPATPSSLTLMAGPIDCRVSPTEVNRLATARSIDWFERHLIGIVPLRHIGALRRVYPGFLQLMAFMNMNLDRHIDSFRTYYDNLAQGEHEKAELTRRFYEEYFAVADLPAEFYLETVRTIFQEFALAQGRLTWRGRTIDPGAIRRTALLTVEGERDDICSLGQTLAAHELCRNLRPYMRTHYIQAGAGHYGVFSGQRWSRHIYPVLRDLIHVSG